MINHSKFLWAILVLAVLVGLSYAAISFSNSSNFKNLTLTASSTASTSTIGEPPTTPIVAGSNITAELYKEITIGNAVLKPWAVLEDSRCPSDVQCVWAGRVRVALNIQSDKESIAGAELQPGQSITTKNLKITLLDVKPNPVSNHKIADSEYRFYFKIESLKSVAATPTPSPSPPKPASKGGCFAGGCSGQICTDDPHALSTCEYRAEYACYKNAVCERQSNGKCGWTETPALKACFSSKGAQAY